MPGEALPTLSTASRLSEILALLVLGYLLTCLALFLQRKKAPLPRLARLGLFLLAALYAAGYLYLTFFYRPPAPRPRLMLRPFWSYREAFSLEGGFQIRRLGVARSILLNILLYVPLGYLLPALFRLTVPTESRLSPLRRHPFLFALLFAMTLSLLTEILQYFTCRGLCELDDLFDNLLGAALGCAAIVVAIRLSRHYDTYLPSDTH